MCISYTILITLLITINKIYSVCQICQHLPKNPIIYYQCKEGHLICSNCYHSDAFIIKDCGLCRNPMNNPEIRNRIAENLIKNTLVKCEFSECNAMMKYPEMQHHLDNECQAKVIACKYKRLGCNWMGPRRNATNHQHSGIDYDTLITKFEGIDENVSMLTCSNKKIQSFNDAIINHNIFGSFDFKAIWENFDLALYDSMYINRFCGNIRKRFRLQISFKIDFQDADPDDDEDEPKVEIFCKMLAQCFGHQHVRELQVLIVYTQGDDHLLVDVFNQNRIIRGEFGQRSYESDWKYLMSIDGNIMEVDKKIKQCDDVGAIRVFACIK